jgi:predicted DNA-binding protein
MGQNQTTMRERQLNVRLSEEESERLETVASHYGLNAAAIIRMLVKREYDAIKAASRGDLAPTRSRKGRG